MFGWGELGIIIVLAIILLGPDKLPEVARTAGKIYAEYKNAKRRLELELLYGYEIPNREHLEELTRKKLDALKEDVASQLQVEDLNTGKSKELKREERKEREEEEKKEDREEGGEKDVHNRPE